MFDLLVSLQGNIYSILTPLIEIIILAIFFYFILYYLKGTRSVSILAGIVFVIMGLTVIADLLNLTVITWILNALWTLFGIALIVIFQPEIRRAFAQLGSNPFYREQRRQLTINEITTAVINLSGKRHGALIAVEQQIGLRGISDNPVILDSKLTHKLLETIFYPNSPLHDGGVIIKNGRIRSANCIFRLSSYREKTKQLGTRHRAALGVAEETDAIVIIVSEETGAISIAYRSNIKRNLSPDHLRRFMKALMYEEKSKTFKEIIDEISVDQEDENKNEEEV